MVIDDWISVKDEEPKDNQKILVTDGEEILSCTIERREKYVFIEPFLVGGWEMEVDIEWNEVTHWVPWPDLPK